MELRCRNLSVGEVNSLQQLGGDYVCSGCHTTRHDFVKGANKNGKPFVSRTVNLLCETKHNAEV